MENYYVMILFLLYVFEAFVYMAHKHGIQNRPGVQVIMTIGGLVADAACEVKMDGK